MFNYYFTRRFTVSPLNIDIGFALKEAYLEKNGSNAEYRHLALVCPNRLSIEPLTLINAQIYIPLKLGES